MLKLEDREWKEFKIIDILGTSHNSKPYHKESLTKVNTNGIPYITRTSFNNGLYAIVKNTEDFQKNPKNSISLGAENAEYFYQPFEYITGNKMYYYHNNKFNKYINLFLVMCLNQSTKGVGFGYANGLTGKKSDTRTILLPTTSNGEPDYEFMEEYIKEREEQKLEEYVSFARKEIEKIEKKIVETNTNHKWKEFYLRDLFEIYHGKRLVKEKIKDGETPLLTASAVNEGVSDFIEDISMKKYKNVITVDMFGHSFYHKYECCGDDNIYFFVNDKLDDEVKQFISVCINRNSNKYSYGKQFREKNALNERVLLPVDKNGTLDIVYIKQYIDIQDVDILFKLSECKLSD